MCSYSIENWGDIKCTVTTGRDGVSYIFENVEDDRAGCVISKNEKYIDVSGHCCVRQLAGKYSIYS